jgi:antitoxin component of MazEF toxin-antitoxin module
VNEQPKTTEIEGYLLQIKKIGNSVGLILPKELLARLPYDPKHAKAMEIARRSFRKYADTYKALAK